jgi:hypothetical protein
MDRMLILSQWCISLTFLTHRNAVLDGSPQGSFITIFVRSLVLRDCTLYRVAKTASDFDQLTVSSQSSCSLGSFELRRKALFHDSHVLAASRHLSQLVVRPPVTGSPAGPADKLIGVVVQHI